MFSVKTIDDAGKVVPLVRCNLIALPFWFGPLPREIQRRVRIALQDDQVKWGPLHSGWWRGIVVVLVPAMVLLLPLGLRKVWPSLPPNHWVGNAQSVLIPLSVFGTFWVLLPWIANDRQRRVVARAAAREGYCGSCGYSLAGAAESDGGTVCSECGAAWSRGPAGDFV